MAANSKHYLDIYTWIKKVIDSCETEDQCESTSNLIDIYFNYILKKQMNISFLQKSQMFSDLTNILEKKRIKVGV